MTQEEKWSLLMKYTPIDDIKSKIDQFRLDAEALREDKDPMIEAYLNNIKPIESFYNLRNLIILIFSAIILIVGIILIL